MFKSHFINGDKNQKSTSNNLQKNEPKLKPCPKKMYFKKELDACCNNLQKTLIIFRKILLCNDKYSLSKFDNFDIEETKPTIYSTNFLYCKEKISKQFAFKELYRLQNCI